MNQERFAGICKQIRGNLKGRLGRLRDNPLRAAEGARDELAGRLQAQYGLSKEQVARELRKSAARNLNRVHPNR
jgi:uncharacterized protein YjbJ (UPF0337 family)